VPGSAQGVGAALFNRTDLKAPELPNKSAVSGAIATGHPVAPARAQAPNAGAQLAAAAVPVVQGLTGAATQSDPSLTAQATEGGYYSPESMPTEAAPAAAVSGGQPPWLNAFVAGAGSLATAFAATPGQLAAGRALQQHGLAAMSKEEEEQAKVKGMAAGLAGKELTPGMDSASHLLGMKHAQDEKLLKLKEQETKSLLKLHDAQTTHQELVNRDLQNDPKVEREFIGPNGQITKAMFNAADFAKFQLEQQKVDQSGQLTTAHVEFYSAGAKEAAARAAVLGERVTIVTPDGIKLKVSGEHALDYMAKIYAADKHAKSVVDAATGHTTAAASAEIEKEKRGVANEMAKNMYETAKIANGVAMRKDDKGNMVAMSTQDKDYPAYRKQALSQAIQILYSKDPHYATHAPGAKAVIDTLKASREEQAAIAKSLGLIPNITNQPTPPPLPKIPATPYFWTRPPGAAGGLTGLPADVVSGAGPALAASNDVLRKNYPPGPFTPSQPILEDAVTNAADWASKLSLTDIPLAGRIIKDFRSQAPYRRQ
jgi:hypothetical protein